MLCLRFQRMLSPEQAGRGKFGEMASETNRGNQFLVFTERASAETWLLS